MTLFFALLLIFVTSCDAKVASNKEHPGNCTNNTAGTTSIVVDREGNDRVLVCVKNNGKYVWRELDNFPTLGNFFNPAKDCSDIVRKKRDAKSGPYWIEGLGLKRPTKVWCDVTTDGGGFMLVGHKKDPESWSVPSNARTVLPQGSPHWSSAFGYVQMTEFRIQISTTNDSENPRADWLYKFKVPRTLTNLLMINGEQGCRSHYPGIGDIDYVKDLLAGEIVTRDFRCSRFGMIHSKGYGWEMMNKCLRSPCKKGYAFVPGTTFRYDSFGAFSYSVNSQRSGIQHNSTAFIGCEHRKCCACFGPKGQKGDFCLPGCRSINGGTVALKAHAWFWIRSSVPKPPVWKKCIEYNLRSQAGKIETFFIEENTGVSKKGSCRGKGIPNLVNGVVQVEDKEALQKLPLAKGLLSYRKDNDQLYLTNGTDWEQLGKEKELEKLERRFNQKTSLLSLELKRVEDLEKKLKKELNNTRKEHYVELRQEMNTSQQKIISEFEKKMDKMEKKLIHELKNVNATLNAKLKKKKVKKFKNCDDIYKDGKKSNGVYDIYPDNQGSFKVLCDMTTDGGGWIVFQRRQDGSVNFYRGWNDYKNGFGDLNREFWLGLDKIYRLTKSQKWVIRFDLEDFSGNTRYAKYSSFAVASESSKYKLSLGSYSGTAGDSLSYHNGMKFTTKDSDNDPWGSNCAVSCKGGWWYKSCHYSNLNGFYYHGSSSSKGVTWDTWRGSYSLKKTEMKIRPI